LVKISRNADAITTRRPSADIRAVDSHFVLCSRRILSKKMSDTTEPAPAMRGNGSLTYCIQWRRYSPRTQFPRTPCTSKLALAHARHPRPNPFRDQTFMHRQVARSETHLRNYCALPPPEDGRTHRPGAADDMQQPEMQLMFATGPRTEQPPIGRPSWVGSSPQQPPRSRGVAGPRSEYSARMPRSS